MRSTHAVVHEATSQLWTCCPPMQKNGGCGCRCQGKTMLIYQDQSNQDNDDDSQGKRNKKEKEDKKGKRGKPGGHLDEDPDDHDGDEGDSSDNWESSDEEESEGMKKKVKSGYVDRWRYDGKFLNKPKDFDGSNLEYFQPWYAMLRAEMITNWPTWSFILDKFEAQGERRISDEDIKRTMKMHAKLGARRPLAEVANEMFRILTGVTSGDVQIAVLKSGVSDIFNAFRRLLAKGKSRTRAALREIKMKLYSTRRATSAAHYDAVVAEWDANVSKLEAYDPEGECKFSTLDKLDTYYLVLPTEALDHARSHIDASSGCDPIDFDEFRTKMETYIHRLVREGRSNQSRVSQVLKDELCKIGLLDQHDADTIMNQEGSDSSLLILAALKGAKGKGKGKGKGNENKLCWNCGKLGHFANRCLEPLSEKNQKKGEKGKGKDGKGKGAITSIQDIFAQINLKVLDASNKGKNVGWIGRPICNISRNEEGTNRDPSIQEAIWERPRKNVRFKKIMKEESQKSKRNRFQELAKESDDEDEPNANEKKVSQIMKCERCVFGTAHEINDQSTTECPGCGRMIDNLFQVLDKIHDHDKRAKAASPRLEGTRKTSNKSSVDSVVKGLNLVTKMSINNITEEANDKIDDITLKLDNLKMIGDQLRDSLNRVRPSNIEANGDWKRLSLTDDSGACDNVVDPRDLPGYILKGTKESRNGETFVTASGNPIPQLGEMEATIYIDGGILRKLRTQCTTVSKPLLSVKRMIEGGSHFVGFCEQGGFLFDLHSGHIEWFREESGNYMLDAWLVPHNKVDDLDKILVEDFQRQSN